MDCVILVGLPGSGKTTFFRNELGGKMRHVSKDDMPNVRNRGARQEQLVAAALAAGESVTIDNTNPARTDRAPLIALAKAAGARVVGYFFEAETREAVARNQKREGRARVPKVAIFTIARRLTPPAYDEGFDEIFRVRALDDGRFDVRPVDRNVAPE